MEAIGAAANLIAVVNLSAKVASLCFEYYKGVAAAREDIERLKSKIDQLGTVLEEAKGLVEGPRGPSLSASQKVTSSFRDARVALERLEKKLSQSLGRNKMRRFGLRALKWPFSSKDVEQAISDLDKHERAILLALQIDQTNIILSIHDEVKDLRLQKAEETPQIRKSHFLVPFPRDPDFIHRPTIWSWIIEQYALPASRMSLVGMGGFGKSQLVIEFAHHLHAESPNASVFWIRASTRATFEESFRSIAEAIALPGRYEPGVNVMSQVRDWLQREDVGTWLIILDNADDISVLFNAESDNSGSGVPLASYLPKTGKGKILITSRSWDAAERLTGSGKAILRIQPMEEAQSMSLFRSKLGMEIDEASALDLVRALDSIPLAVSQAAAYIFRRSPRVTVESYLADLRKNDRHKSSLLRSDRGDMRRYENLSNSVLMTWQVTFEQLRREHPRAANLLSLMSFFQAQNIPGFMLYGYGNGPEEDVEDTFQPPPDEHMAFGHKTDTRTHDEEQEFEDDIEVLNGYSLIGFTTKEAYFEMHPLVQSCTQAWISEAGISARWQYHFLRSAQECFPCGAFETWETCQTLLPHIQPLLGQCPSSKKYQTLWSALMYRVAYYFSSRGEFGQSVDHAEAALHARRETLGEDHTWTLDTNRLLVHVYSYNGEMSKAQKLALDLWEKYKVKYGLRHRETTSLLAVQCLVDSELVDLEDVLKAHEEALEADRQMFGPHHPHILRSIERLVIIYRSQGRWDEAEQISEKLLQSYKTSLGDDHPDTVRLMGHQAYTYWHQGQWEKAVEKYSYVLDQTRRRLGVDHPSTLNVMRSLACTLFDMGESGRDQAVALTQQLLRLEDPTTTTVNKTSLELRELLNSCGAPLSSQISPGEEKYLSTLDSTVSGSPG